MEESVRTIIDSVKIEDSWAYKELVSNLQTADAALGVVESALNVARELLPNEALYNRSKQIQLLPPPVRRARKIL